RVVKVGSRPSRTKASSPTANRSRSRPSPPARSRGWPALSAAAPTVPVPAGEGEGGTAGRPLRLGPACRAGGGPDRRVRPAPALEPDREEGDALEDEGEA